MPIRKGNFFMGSIHIMQIKQTPKGKVICVDNGPEYTVKDFLHDHSEDYELLGKIATDRPIHRQRISISWEDEQGDRFEMEVADTWTLRNIFYQFPFLAKPFNYLPKSSPLR